MPSTLYPTIPGARRARLRLVLLAALTVGACRAPANAPPLPVGAVLTEALRADVAWLSADAREGRGTGTAGFDSASAFVAMRFAALGIGHAPQMAGYFQPFTARVTAARGGTPASLPTQNVVAYIPGRDPQLAGEVIVLGAHLDHLGRGAVGVLDPELGPEIRNGADDNASGTAIVLELARRFHVSRMRRSVLLVLFSGEEYGLLGSQFFVENSPVALVQVQAMLNFDMVGRLRNDRLIVYGVGTAAELPSLMDSVSAGSGLILSKVPDGIGPSDHASFHTKDLPVLHFFTDIHDDYHRASDDVERINAAGMLRVADLAEKAARALGDRHAKLVVTRTVAAVGPSAASRRSSGVYLGSIPDMGAADVVGMRITGVRADSPAEKGGLLAGDVIVEFGGKPVKDIYEYTDALNSFKPGDVVAIIVVREGQRVTLQITLGRRGG